MAKPTNWPNLVQDNPKAVAVVMSKLQGFLLQVDRHSLARDLDFQAALGKRGINYWNKMVEAFNALPEQD